MKSTKIVFGIVFLVISLFIITLTFFRVFYPINYREDIIACCDQFNLPKEVVASIINAESRFDKNAVSHKGAIGLMQLLPTTAQQVANDLGISFTPDDLYTPSTNILLGTYYLYTLLDRFNDLNTAICAYNAGPSKVSTWLKNSEYSTDQKTLYNTPYKETNNYLNKILRGQRIYKIYF